MQPQLISIMQCVVDGSNSSNNLATSPSHDENHPTDIEVYLLFKAIHSNSYFPDAHVTHHVLLFKLREKDEAFYYTDLDSSNFGLGQIRIVFGPYSFYQQKTIYYKPLGISRNRTLAQIRQFAETNSLNGQSFSMFKQNCQHYVSSCIEFLGLDKSELQSDDVYWTKDAQSMTLSPPSTARVLSLKPLACLTVIFFFLIVHYL